MGAKMAGRRERGLGKLGRHAAPMVLDRRHRLGAARDNSPNDIGGVSAESGVHFGGGLAEDSELLVFVRTVATALVAAVIGNLVVFPSGALAEAALMLRVAAAVLGFAAYFLLGKKVLAGILMSEAVLAAGMWVGL